MNHTIFRFRRGDLLAAAVVLLAALLAALALPGLTARQADFARIYQDGQLIRQVPLDVDQTFRIRGNYTNTVTVQDGQIAVTHSDCPTNDCVRQGWRQDGGSIICLPNGVEIRLSGGTDLVIR